jgi:hypothetical protein
VNSACRPAIRVLVLTLAFHTAGCSLTETSLAAGNDIVIVELILRAGDTDPQRAFLYRTIGTGQSSVVPGAAIEVSDAAGRVMMFVEVPVRNCIDDVMGPIDGTCYLQAGSPFEILAGSTYSMRITIRDGGVLTGTTTVPGNFEVVVPSDSLCRLEPGRTLDLRWTPSQDAWVYVAEAALGGLADALAPEGIDLAEDPLRLLGLSISREDTTLAFPTGFGLFDRADPDVADALVAIRDGLPPGVRASVVVAAADRNYVNWVRGGNFNPSGLVRVPSVRGDGTGVFGSIVAKTVVLTTVPESTAPACE